MAGPGTPERLRDSRDIVAVLRGRRQRAGRLAVVHVRERSAEGPPRVAVVASRKVGSAVARNRAKRLLREAARSVPWRPGMDVVLVARSTCVEATTDPVRAEVAELAAGLGALDPAGRVSP